MTDLLAIGISFVYVFAALGLAEGLRRAFKLDIEFTRKVVHISVGMWAWGTAALFQDKWLAMVTPAAFVVINALSYRFGLFLAMESRDRRNLGTIYFPIAFIALIALFWGDLKPLFVATLMPMTWGDAFAAVIGRRFGRHRYTVFGATRSLEGSLAMFAFSFVSVWIALLAFFTGGPLAGIAWLPALAAALLATAAEAVSPFGLDNLLVPAVSAAALALIGIR
jgi:phytol kinase